LPCDPPPFLPIASFPPRELVGISSHLSQSSSELSGAFPKQHSGRLSDPRRQRDGFFFFSMRGQSVRPVRYVGEVPSRASIDSSLWFETLFYVRNKEISFSFVDDPSCLPRLSFPPLPAIASFSFLDLLDVLPSLSEDALPTC